MTEEGNLQPIFLRTDKLVVLFPIIYSCFKALIGIIIEGMIKKLNREYQYIYDEKFFWLEIITKIIKNPIS